MRAGSCRVLPFGAELDFGPFDKVLEIQRENGAGDGIRTHDFNLGKVKVNSERARDNSEELAIIRQLLRHLPT